MTDIDDDWDGTWDERDDYDEPDPDDGDDGDDRYDEYKDDLAMGYINPDGSQREPDPPWETGPDPWDWHPSLLDRIRWRLSGWKRWRHRVNTTLTATQTNRRSEAGEEQVMPTITIYGASDDCVEVAGCEGADEFSADRWQGDLVAPGAAEQMRVHCWYDDSGCWQVGIGQVIEDVQLPPWPVTISQAPAMNPANPGYSALLTIEAPDGTRLTNVRPSPDA